VLYILHFDVLKLNSDFAALGVWRNTSWLGRPDYHHRSHCREVRHLRMWQWEMKHEMMKDSESEHEGGIGDED